MSYERQTKSLRLPKRVCIIVHPPNDGGSRVPREHNQEQASRGDPRGQEQRKGPRAKSCTECTGRRGRHSGPVAEPCLTTGPLELSPAVSLPEQGRALPAPPTLIKKKKKGPHLIKTK